MSSSIKKGKFIVFAGGEGSGKDTQVALLKERLPEERFYFTREPGGSDLAELIRTFMLKSDEGKRMSLEAHFACAWASRAHHMETVIKPKLDAGINVISNRGDCCTFAYQLYGQQGLHLVEAFWIMRNGIMGDYKPDLYLWLDVSSELSSERVRNRAGEKNHFDEQVEDFHKRVRSGYENFFSNSSIPNSKIDGSKTIEQVEVDISNALEPLIG